MDSATTVQLDERVYRTDLPGGPAVLTEEVPGVRSASAGIWFRWGSSQEPEDRLGISHLLEHMVFKGTERRTAREIALEIEGIGGALDAYTTREHTAYYARVLDEYLPIALDVLTDLAFHPLLRDRDLALERNVILEEIAGVEDAPEELVFDLHARALWGEHPYGRPVLGTRETVESISASDLRTLQRSVYRPTGCVLAAAGNVRHEELLEQVAAGFPDDPEPVQAPPLPTPESRATESRVEREAAQVHVCVGAGTFPHNDPRRYAMSLISTATGGGMSSRLFQRVREELGLAYTVYSFQSFYRHGGHVGMYLATRPETTDRALEVVREELSGLASDGLEPEELSSVKNQAKGQIVLSLESTSARMHRLAGLALYDEPYLTIDELCARIDSVARDEVAELCRTYYAPERQAVVCLGPRVRDGLEGGARQAARSDAGANSSARDGR